jgi:hypothetical protein
MHPQNRKGMKDVAVMDPNGEWVPRRGVLIQLGTRVIETGLFNC